MRFKFKQPSLNLPVYIAGGVSLAFAIVFLIWLCWSREILIIKPSSWGIAQVSRITGMSCEYPDRRPIAVMLAADPVARPLSGIRQADLVVEMPVTPNGVTRLMAVYQCQEPEIIGSVRSARDGFIPYAAMLNAIYAHWGGEQETLEQLNNHILDNIDALKYEEQYFFRVKHLKAPHNGFTTYEKLFNGAEELGYELSGSSFSFAHSNTKPLKNITNFIESVIIPYPEPYTVRWEYNEQKDNYGRFRDGTPELDADGIPVSASALVVLETTAEPLRDQYLVVATQGSGRTTVYQHGMAISGTWNKDKEPLNTPLSLEDTKGEPISLAPGVVWITFITE